MVSFNTVLSLALAISTTYSFSLLHDDQGYAILPPTEKVLEYLKEVGKTESSNHYEVVNTVHEDGEIIQVNLHSHEMKKTGKYKHNYDNSCYNNRSKRDAVFNKRVIEDLELKHCFNEEYELETSQCGFDFVSYDGATNCTSDSSKYSCILDIMKQQDATKKLKDMDTVPAQVRCYHDLSIAQNDEVYGGACSN
ncbi:hypothetical protein KGF56_001447 [Candida oxycetoniae]|uniref:Secreted protein n=1 Tax=Candida oxycetoniae TaxID=497107 RepID=A0AAI9SZV3_9ASCO|nr:uncharacterized protein KGF56_001447 [Candida oxycetoniae]KAI3405840.1 hypothetical protein KGF56_001447 [Candida oxycetoniae]